MVDQETSRESKRTAQTSRGGGVNIDYQDLDAKFGATGEYRITFDANGKYRQIVKTDGDQTVQYFLLDLLCQQNAIHKKEGQIQLKGTVSRDF